jgi:hypothetical protein
MDDDRIRALTEEVVGALRRPAGTDETVATLESRVAALEAAVRELRGPARPPAAEPVRVALAVSAHPSASLLHVSGGAERCVLEPDRPCDQSGLCRALGH